MKKSYLFALPMAIGLFGCNQQAPAPEPKPADGTTTSQSTPAPEPASSLPADAPVVHVAMTGVDEPFTFKDEKGSLTGLEYDIIQAVANSQGLKVDPIIVSPNNLLSGLDAKSYDLVIAVMGYTDERASKYGVSKPYFSSPSAIMHIKPELTINSYKDLAGMNVAVGGGSFHEKDLKAMGTAKSLDTLDSTYLMFQGMVQGKYDAIIQDQTMLQYTATKYPDVKTIISPYYADEKEGNDDVVMIMNKDNTELLEKINKGIDEIKANGKLDEISQKWLNAPAPK